MAFFVDLAGKVTIELDENPLAHYDLHGWRIGLHSLRADVAREITQGLRRPSDVASFVLAADPAEVLAGSVDALPLAWTGVTDIQPVSLEIQSFIGPNPTTGTSVAHSFEMTVVEPGGPMIVSALDAHRAIQGYPNIMDIGWLITVELNGTIAEGHEVLPTGARSRAIGRRFGEERVFAWMVNLVEMNTTVDQTGARHVMRFTPVAELALFIQENVLPRGFEIGAATVGEALDQLAEILNARVGDADPGNDGSFPQRRLHEIVVHPIDPAFPGYALMKGLNVPPDPREWNLAGFQSTSAIRIYAFDTGTGVAIHAAKGDRISDVIREIVHSTIEHSLLATGGATHPETADSRNDANPFRIVYEVRPEVVYLEGRAADGGIPKLMRWHVVPTLRVDTPGSAQQVAGAVYRSPELSADLIGLLAESGRLKKFYPYTYTGLNTEILDLEMDWRFLWYMTTSQNIGADSSDVQAGATPLIPAVIRDLMAGGRIHEVVGELIPVNRAPSVPTGGSNPNVTVGSAGSPTPGISTQPGTHAGTAGQSTTVPLSLIHI